MSKIYTCPRCGYSHNMLCHFKYHLQRQYICKPLVADVSLDGLKSKYCKKQEKKFCCDICSKRFSSRTGFHNHKKKCIPQEDNVEDANAEIVNAIDSVTSTSNIAIESINITPEYYIKLKDLNAILQLLHIK